MKTDSNLCLKSSGILVLLFLIGAGQAFSHEVFELPPVSPTMQVAYLNSLPEMDGQVEFDRSVSWVPIPEIDWQVNPLIYGTFSEPVVFDRPIYGELFAQLLRNSSFEWGFPTFEQTLEAYAGRYQEMDPEDAGQISEGKWLPVITIEEEKVAAPWIGVGKGRVNFSFNKAAFNTEFCQGIEIGPGSENAGVAQIISLPLWRCSKYHFQVYLRSADTNREVKVHLYHKGGLIDHAVFSNIDQSWKPFKTIFTTPVMNEQQNTFLLAIISDDPCSYAVDQATLYPADTIAGFDPQALGQFRELNTGWTRWPGGNYASIYNWNKQKCYDY